jgi:hypothetical protein
MAWTNYPKLGAKIHGLSVYPRKKKMMKYPDIYQKMMINHDKP